MDWSGCDAVERVPGKVSGQWIVKGTRVLADGIVDNADTGYTAEQIAGEVYDGLPLDLVKEILAHARKQRAAHPA